MAPIRTFRIPKPGKNQELLIHITEPDVRAQGLALETWAASSVQAKLIQNLPQASVQFPPKDPGSNQSIIPILELGAGTGMVGVSACVRWNQPTVITDLEGIVPGLAANISINRDNLKDNQMLCGTLDWCHPSNLSFYPKDVPSPFSQAKKAHVILAADTIYCAEHPPMLASTIVHWLSREPTARLIMCLPLRVCYLDELREMWKLLEEAGLECIEDGQENADEKLFNDECLCEWSIWRWKQAFHSM
jgi:hypothetical protein